MIRTILTCMAIVALVFAAAAQPVEWTASSTLAPQGENDYIVENLQNADPSVAWCEGVKGQGIGERVNAKIKTFDSAHIKSLVIVNGYAKDQATWKNNSRIKTLRLYADGKHLSDLHLSNIIKPQIIQLPESIAIKGGHPLDLSFEIAEVYPGSKFEDACITSVAFDVYVGTDIVDPRDKQIYRTVKIGTQNWMAENLSFKSDGSRCYGDNERNCERYGRQYNWEEAMKACPSGWHLPSDEEWETLVKYVDPNAGSGCCNNRAGTKLKSKSGWNEYEGRSGNGTDEYGFSALPGGHGYDNGSFRNVGDYGGWWSSTENDAARAYGRGVNNQSSTVYRGGLSGKSYRYSVRCLRDLGEVNKKGEQQ